MTTLTKTPLQILDEVPRNAHFHVAPRYTAGSPAMVDRSTACHVAAEEVEAMERQISGVYGEELKAQAGTLGMSWIAYARWQKGKKVFRLDLITGETIQEPPPINWHEERDRLLILRNRKQYGNMSWEAEQELATLEFRATIHRQEIK